MEENLQWTGEVSDTSAEAESSADLVESARTLYRKGLQLYVGGDNVAAEQALTDAGLAVDIASESELTDSQEEELGVLQEKIAFFLDQLTPPGSGTTGSNGSAPGSGSGVLASRGGSGFNGVVGAGGGTAGALSTRTGSEARADLLASNAERTPSRLPEIEIVMNDRVKKWIDYFTGRGRDRYQIWLERTGRYRDVIYPILEEEGLPRDLIYLSLIESGMNPTAVSWAKAEGMWQFIKSTAKLYNVKMDWWVDERRDPVKSCRAASQHLRDLYTMFDDWLLALAAYNTGAGRVQHEIVRCRTRNYWDLRLPTQTRDYVPEFMAAAIIGHSPEKYGFSPRYHDPMQFDMVEVDGPLSLAAVARCAGVSTDVLAELNPKLRRKAVPPYPRPYLLRVPPGTGESCQNEIAQMTAEERAKFSVNEPARSALASADRHRVRRGETLSGIARRYGTTTTALARANKMRERDVIRVGMTLRIPGGAAEPVMASARRTREAPPAGTTYTVRKGDTPAAVASRFGMPVSALLALNDLPANARIYPGDELMVAPPAPDAVVASAVESPRSGGSGAAPGRSGGESAQAGSRRESSQTSASYVVKRGDTLYDIATRFGTTTRALELANGLHRNELIRAGDRLVIPGTAQAVVDPQADPARVAAGNSPAGSDPGPSVARASDARPSDDSPAVSREVAMADTGMKLILYRVRRGDTLAAIAARFGVQLASLRHWNQMASNAARIQAGQMLKVYLPLKQAG